MTATAALLHVGDSLLPRYQAALPGYHVVNVARGGLSASYDAQTGLAAEYPTLRAFLAAHAPSWRPGEPLVLVSWSAGTWALRHWLRDPQARQDASAVVILDGLHSGEASSGGCRLDTIEGVVDYARTGGLLVVTNTEIDPVSYASTTECADLVDEVAPASIVLDYPGKSPEAHLAQVREVGPAVIREYVTGQRSLAAVVGFGVAIAGVAVAAYMFFK